MPRKRSSDSLGVINAVHADAQENRVRAGGFENRGAAVSIGGEIGRADSGKATLMGCGRTIVK